MQVAAILTLSWPINVHLGRYKTVKLFKSYYQITTEPIDLLHFRHKLHISKHLMHCVEAINTI